MAITFDKPNKYILITSPQTEVTIQDLVDAIRDYEEILDNFDIFHIAEASGKQDLGGGVLVGITLELLDGWRVYFEDRPGPSTVSVSITGGNIVAINAFNNNPVAPSEYTQVSITSSSSATISQLEIINLAYKIESLRVSHSRFGQNIYWDPIGGDDGQVGDTPDRALLTFAQCHSLANTGDVIYIVTDNSVNGIVETNEEVTITKDGISLRGPGSDFIINHLTGNGGTIEIRANNVEISGVQIIHDVGVTAGTYGIFVDGATAAAGADNIFLHNIWIRSTKSDGININTSGDSKIQNIVIEDVGGDGIDVAADVDDLIIEKCLIDRSSGSGIHIISNGLDTIIRNNEIHDNDLYGINIGSSAVQTIIRQDNILFDNITGPINDQGSFTTIESFEDDTSTFQGAVHIDIANGVSGTDFPKGNVNNPINNIADARIIANYRGLREYHISGTITLDQSHTNWSFVGASLSPTVNLNGQDIDGSQFMQIEITGINSGTGIIRATDCTLNSVTNLNGIFTSCGLNGTSVLTADGNSIFFNCHSDVAGPTKPILDFNAGQNVSGQLRAYSGGIEIRNFDNSLSDLSIDLVSGRITLASTCTDGDIIIGGVGDLEDNSNGSVINTKSSALGMSIGRFRGQVFIDPNNGVSGTTFPTGTDERPSNNLTDAISIADTNGFSTFTLRGGTLTVTGAVDLSNKTFQGEGVGNPVIILADGQATTTNTAFNGMAIAGILNGIDAYISNCIVGIGAIGLGLSSFSGFMANCILQEDLTLIGTGAANLRTIIADTASVYDTGSYQTININGSQPLSMLNYSGNVVISGKTATDLCDITMTRGNITIDNTNTLGTITLYGSGNVTDNSNGTTVNTDALIQPTHVIDTRDEAMGRWVLDKDTDVLTLYKEDGATVLRQFNLTSTNETVPNYITRTPV